MPTDASFRFSTYLAFALACVSLGYAEFEMLPEVAAFGALSIVGLGVLYFLESRVTLLSIPAANRLGMGIGLVYLMWTAFRVKRELDTSEFASMGWHTFIMALCGPLVMLLLVAKVARSDKHAGDYWTLHGVALAGVGLAAAFAEEPLCFALVGLYLAAAVWSLTLLHLGRAQGTIPPIPGGKQPATKAIAVSADPTGHRTDLRPALLCAGVAVAVAVPLYLLTPRSEASKAEFGKPRIEIGYAADQMVDLNRTGPLKANKDPAFEVVAAYPDGTPKVDLPGEQRWRGKALSHYSGGEWRPTEMPSPAIIPLARRADAWIMPELGPRQYTLEFQLPGRARGTFLADPIIWAPDQPPPIAAITEAGLRGWLPVSDGTFFWDPAIRTRGAVRRYVQVYRARQDSDASPAFRFADPRRADAELSGLRLNPVPRVKEYADAVLKEMVRAGELPDNDKESFRHPVTLMPLPEYQERIARKFAAHLASTPDLQYTTDLKRENTRVDPIEDFLFHSKVGHCERYATALALMLRSQGIPSMFVLGFKGCEHEEGGRYVVRQEHAHAWVEALVPVPNQPPPRPPFGRLYYWRSLDPTPGGTAETNQANPGWLDRANTWMESQFQEYLKNYTPEQRQKAITQFAARLTRTDTLVGIAAVIALAIGLRYLRRWYARRDQKPAPAPDAARWFGELLALLATHGLAPTVGETAMEFATSAAATLRLRPGCAEVADVPLVWANAYYQDRFGGQPPSDARMAELEAELEALRRALAH